MKKKSNTPKGKTIKQWFNAIEDKIVRGMLFENTPEFMLVDKRTYKNFHSALLYASPKGGTDTPQKERFWNAIYNHFRIGSGKKSYEDFKHLLPKRERERQEKLHPYVFGHIKVIIENRARYSIGCSFLTTDNTLIKSAQGAKGLSIQQFEIPNAKNPVNRDIIERLRQGCQYTLSEIKYQVTKSQNQFRREFRLGSFTNHQGMEIEENSTFKILPSTLTQKELNQHSKTQYGTLDYRLDKDSRMWMRINAGEKVILTFTITSMATPSQYPQAAQVASVTLFNQSKKKEATSKKAVKKKAAPFHPRLLEKLVPQHKPDTNFKWQIPGYMIANITRAYHFSNDHMDVIFNVPNGTWYKLAHYNRPQTREEQKMIIQATNIDLVKERIDALPKGKLGSLAVKDFNITYNDLKKMQQLKKHLKMYF